LKTVESTLIELFTVTGENASKAGKIVQEQLLNRLSQLQNIGSNLSSITNSSSRNYGNNPLGMSTNDFSSYVANKKAWTDGTATQAQLQQNADLRKKYGISNDIYTYDDLKGYYATGTNDVKNLYMTGEGGREIVTLNPNGTNSVIPNSLTEKIVSLAQNAPSILSNLVRPNISVPQFPSALSGVNGVNVSFGSLLTVGQLTNMSQGELNSMIDKASDIAITKIKNALYRSGR
jgi:hypothetical protein